MNSYVPCNQVLDGAGYADRVKAAAQFNAGSRYRKRGVAATPTKFGISFTTKFLNQVTQFTCRCL